MTDSNGMVVIPEETEGIEAGETVEVNLFRPLEKEDNDK
jgi:molybdopterin biosynthesis enzyme